MNKKIKKIIREIINDQPEVAAAYLFGSCARGEEVVNDIDVLVLLYPDTDRDSFYMSATCRIAEALEITSDKVDLLYFDLSEADPWVLHNAINEGILLKDEDPDLLTDRIEQVSLYFLENDVVIRRAKELKRERLEVFHADKP